MTKVINFWAGPGAGKSTCATGCFSALKRKHMNAEYVSEYAKELTWKNSLDTLKDQFHVFGEQHHRQASMVGKVDYLLTDSPLPLAVIYGRTYGNNYPDCFYESIMWAFNQFDNINFLVKRRSLYNPLGRVQTLEEAKEKDIEIEQFLLTNNIPYDVIHTDADHVTQVLARLSID